MYISHEMNRHNCQLCKNEFLDRCLGKKYGEDVSLNNEPCDEYEFGGTEERLHEIESSKNSFIQKCLNGEAELSELDNYIEYWHTHNVEVSLRNYLGLTPGEYEEWGSGRDSIYDHDEELFKDIIRCRREGIDFKDYQHMNK